MYGVKVETRAKKDNEVVGTLGFGFGKDADSALGVGADGWGGKTDGTETATGD